MLLVTLLAALLPASLAVKCYTCSWSPKDAPNRTVMCSDEFFEGNIVAISECPHGCQAYFHTDRNGAILQVRRSCLQAGDAVTGDCVSEENKAFSSRKCTCNYNMCNDAFCTSPLTCFALAAIALVLLKGCKTFF